MSIKQWLLHSPSMWHAGSARTVAQIAEKGNLGLGRGMHADRHCNDTHFSNGGCKQCLNKNSSPMQFISNLCLESCPSRLAVLHCKPHC